MIKYGNGDSMSKDEFNEYILVVTEQFNVTEPEYHAQKLAFEVMWIIDQDRNNRVDRAELGKFIKGLTLNLPGLNLGFAPQEFVMY